MRVCIIGTGYVGLVTGACLANVGHTVCCVDNDAKRIDCLNAGKIPFYEPGLAEIVAKNKNEKMLSFRTNHIDALGNAEICMIAVGTPSSADGYADLSFVEQAAREIGRSICGNLIVVNKSTVPVGTEVKVRKWIKEEMDARSVSFDFCVVSNPEFLKEGNAVEDFCRPDRIIIGSRDETATKALKEMYASFNQQKDRILVMSPESAELTKYASNAMLATRISFMNELAALCEKVGANINDIRLGMGQDERIGPSFLYAGCGFGGSCFPKDVLALISMQKQLGVSFRMMDAVNETNERQKHVMFEKVKNHFVDGLSCKRIAVWGLSFKPKTDDVRQSPSITFINEITAQGAEVLAYCPQGMENAEIELCGNPLVSFVKHKYDALVGADALALMTEWAEFRNPDFDEIAILLNNKVIFDGRNIYMRNTLEKKGFTLYQIGM